MGELSFLKAFVNHETIEIYSLYCTWNSAEFMGREKLHHINKIFFLFLFFFFKPTYIDFYVFFISLMQLRDLVKWSTFQFQVRSIKAHNLLSR